MKKREKFLATLLTLACLIATSMPVMAAEPRCVEPTESVVVANNDEAGIMPMSIYGYAAKYTNPMSGSFVVNSPGSGNSRGTFQITTHDFPTNPSINAVLYRPDGTCAGQIYVTGNGTKSIRFSNAIPGDYTVIYAVDGTERGWISAWVTS